MTLEEIKSSDSVFLSPADVAEILHCNPNFIRVAARDKPQLLGFPVTVIGTRTRIPRKPFLRFVGEDDGLRGMAGAAKRKAAHGNEP